MEKNTSDDQSIGKTGTFHELEGRGSKTKQSRLENLLPPSSSFSYVPNTKKETAAGDTAAVFSSQNSQFAEYTTWKGIENKTGIEKKNAITFLAKESLDNASDCLETTQYHNNTPTAILQPEIHILIEKSQGNMSE